MCICFSVCWLVYVRNHTEFIEHVDCDPNSSFSGIFDVMCGPLTTVATRSLDPQLWPPVVDSGIGGRYGRWFFLSPPFFSLLQSSPLNPFRESGGMVLCQCQSSFWLRSVPLKAKTKGVLRATLGFSRSRLQIFVLGVSLRSGMLLMDPTQSLSFLVAICLGDMPFMFRRNAVWVTGHFYLVVLALSFVFIY